MPNDVITTLTNFARFPKPDAKPFVLESCVREALEDCTVPGGVEVALDFPSDLPPALADPGQIRIVLGNLIRNAMDAMAFGGRLTLIGRRSENGLEVDVTDTGVGIAREDLGRIMEPLFSTKARGMGLGLALSRMIVDRNHGNLRVESEVGKGSTFTVRLAVAGGRNGSDMTERAASILLVDDDEDICQNMADIFSDLGFEVDVAHEGGAALELVRKRPYDVALLDLKMPGMDGLTLYREIKKLQSGMVAFLVTAYAGGSVADQAITAGAWRVLPKPVDLPRLQSLIDEALGRPLVLVVDDDDDLCANLWDLLRERGYRLSIAHDARASGRATTRFDQGRPARSEASRSRRR